MKNKICLIVVLSGLLISPFAQASVETLSAVNGTIKSFDENFVRVVSGKTIFNVPRKLIVAPRLEVKQAITVQMSKTDFDKLTSEPVK